MRVTLLLFGLILCLISHSQDFEDIRTQLEAIELQSLKLRSKVMPTVREFGFESPQMDFLNTQIMEFDSSSLTLVEDIINKYGWLGRKQIGESGNNTLFLTIQHAQDKEVTKKYFPLLQESAKKGDSKLSDMATIKDRMLVENGKPQLYGSQSRMVNGKLETYPIEDPKNVNKRRKKVGLKKLK